MVKMPMTPGQRVSLKRYLVFLEEELADLPRFRALTYAVYSTDRDTRRNVERLCENLVNASIDIGKILLASQSLQIPNSYREVFESLGYLGVISPETSEALQAFTRLRSIPAHEYLDVRWEQLRALIEGGGTVLVSLMRVSRSALQSGE